MLQTGLFNLFRPRLDDFFDIELPMEEDKRKNGDEVPSRKQWARISEERFSRLDKVESAAAAAVSSQNLGLQRMVLMP